MIFVIFNFDVKRSVVPQRLLAFRIMQVNSFLSRIIEVAENQKVVDTDVYGVVRHLMYIGMSILYIVSPIVPGS